MVLYYTCTVEFEVLPSNPMFNDTLWFYIIHVQVYSVTALINTLLNLKFYLLTRCLMTHCGFISYMYRYIVSPALNKTLLNLKFYLLTRCLMTHCGFISYMYRYIVSPALNKTLLNLKFYLLTRCLMTHCGFISYMYRYIVSLHLSTRC